jgi:tetratricopeptide (TPR) repeat protein
VVHLREAARLLPADAAVHFQLGLLSAELGKTDDAIAAFREVRRLAPDDGDGHFNLGVVLNDKLRALVDEKVEAFQKAVALRPGRAEAHYHLAVAYVQKAQLSPVDEKRLLLSKALEQFRLFQRAAPTDPKAAAAAHNIEVLEPQVK